MKTRTCVTIAICTLAIGGAIGYFSGAGIISRNPLNDPPAHLIGVWETTRARDVTNDGTQTEPELWLFADWSFIHFRRSGRRDGDVIGYWRFSENDVVLKPLYFSGTAANAGTQALTLREEAGSRKLRDADGRVYTRTSDFSRIVFNDIEVGRTTSSHAFQHVSMVTRRRFPLWEVVSRGGQVMSD